MVPTHIEQTCNAFDAQQSGCCAVSDRFDLDTLLALSKRSIDPALFRHWVQQANWLILPLIPQHYYKYNFLST